MMSGQDLYLILGNLTDELRTQVSRLEENGKSYANAYTNYRIAVAKKLLELRASGYPVTICSDLARGDMIVAKAKLEELTTETIYKANLERINAIKLEIKVIQNQIDKEFGFQDD